MTSLQQNELFLDAASASSRGARSYQEDALVTDFPIGGEISLLVLADGMGGHAAGDVASKIAVTEVFSDLKLQSGDSQSFRAGTPEILREAAEAANACIRSYAETHREARGLGTTLLALVLVEKELYWLSVGDSPLYLYRDGALRQLNEDHSMAPQIDFLVSAGQITPEEGEDHPDRNALTSVICGARIARIDCPDGPFALRPGDILLAASDGLQFLPDDEIAAQLSRRRSGGSAGIAKALLAAIEKRDDPAQDNVTFSVVRVVGTGVEARSRIAATAAAGAITPANQPAPVAAPTPSVFASFAAMLRSGRG